MEFRKDPVRELLGESGRITEEIILADGKETIQES